jgi:hypothetical protein
VSSLETERGAEGCGRFLMSPLQHRRRAEELRNSHPGLAKHHEQLAKAIEKRHAG